MTAMCAARDIGTGVLSPKWNIVTSPYVHHNRNEIWREWSRGETDHLLMVDDDLEWGPDVLDKLGTALMQAPVAFVDIPISMLATSAFVHDIHTEPIPFKPAPYHEETFLCDGFASAMVMFHRSIIKRLPRNPFNLVAIGDEQINEDLSFSTLCYQKAIKVACVPNLDVTHHKLGGRRPRNS